MKNKTNIFVFLFSCIEIIIITILMIALVGKKHLPFFSFLSSWFHHESPITINALSEKDQDFIASRGYAYYYDFPKNKTGGATIAWLNHAVVYHYNNDGFNDRNDYIKEKSSTTFRAVTLGDSFVFGMWVDTKDNFSEQLEDMLNTRLRCPIYTSFEVINGGAPSFDLRYAAKRYADKGSQYVPDAVIWFIRGENLFLNTDSYYRLEDEYKEKLKMPGAYLQYHMSPVDPFAASHLAYKTYEDNFNQMNPQEQDISMQPEIQAVTGLNQRYDASVFLVTPQKEEDRYKQILQHIVSSGKHIWYQELPAFQTFEPNDYHPNVAGHKQIAESLFLLLRSTMLKDCIDVSP